MWGLGVCVAFYVHVVEGVWMGVWVWVSILS